VIDIGIEVKIPDTPLFRGQGKPIVDEEIGAATEYGVNLALGAIIPNTPVGVTGNLRGGVQSEVVRGSGVDVLGRVFDPVAYALPVDRGAQPHFPPSSALELWVRRKLDVPDKLVRSVAFLVARAISRRGTAARKFFADSWAHVKPQAEARYQQALARIAARLGGQ
jgi:hypothetical protein